MFCSNCGQEIADHSKLCADCGKKLTGGAFCSECGTRL